MEQMAALSRKGPLSDLILMKRAMLDTTTQPRLTIVLSVLGGMAIGALLCALSVVVWSQEGHWLRELFGG